MRTSLILILFLVLFSWMIPSSASAAGTFDCEYLLIGTGPVCVPANDNCTGGDTVDPSLCSSFANSQIDCENNKGLACVAQAGGGGPIRPIQPLDPEGSCGAEKINTAIGCVPISSSETFVGWVLGWAIGIGGGIAFLMIVYSGIMILTSAGNPQKVQAGKELLTSAISGILLLIFSAFILRIIGVNVLGIFS